MDADLSACFDTIPHKELMILVGKRISDQNVADKLYNQGAFEILVQKYGLIDPTKYFLKETVKT